MLYTKREFLHLIIKMNDMEQSKIIIEALNPVNKSNIDTIIHTISKMEGVSSVGVNFDDQYKFIFYIDHEEALLQSITGQVKSLLMFYGSAILTLKEDKQD